MENGVSDNTMAVLLLTTHLGKKQDAAAKPLTPTEWGEFAAWMHEHSLGPADLLRGDVKQTLGVWSHRKVTLDRLDALLNRGSALGMALEKWQRAGLWVITRSDPAYPRLLKQRLRHQAPPVFFGCGSLRLLNQNGIAVVGSRSASDADLEFTRRLGARVADQAYSIVSGGARGVDEAAMLGALEAEGTCAGVLAKDLLRATTSAKYRQYLTAGNLVLVTPFNPEAGFNAGNAMARNKYIYCLSRAGIAIHSGTKGGTWTGAKENMRRAWVPMWVKPTNDPQAGNQLLAEQGAAWLSIKLTELDVHHLEQPGANSTQQTGDLLSDAASSAANQDAARKSAQVRDIGSTEGEPLDEKQSEAVLHQQADIKPTAPATNPVDEHGTPDSSLSLYQYFLLVLEQQLATPQTEDTLRKAGQLKELRKIQLDAWLNKAEKDDIVSVLNKGDAKFYEWNGKVATPRDWVEEQRGVEVS